MSTHVLTPSAAARLLGVTIEEIGRLQDNGELPVYNLGGEEMVPSDAPFAYARRTGRTLDPYFRSGFRAAASPAGKPWETRFE